jgi:hypothetical protein
MDRDLYHQWKVITCNKFTPVVSTQSIFLLLKVNLMALVYPKYILDLLAF